MASATTAARGRVAAAAARAPLRAARARARMAAAGSESAGAPDRRSLLLGGGAVAAAAALDLRAPAPAHAVNGTVQGRIPGVSEEADEEGFRMYTRPEGKGGGHGVGWSEFPPYQFLVPPGWEEQPVSIADPAGTELDLKFASKAKKGGGEAAVLIEPVLRFMDVGFNANVVVTDVGPPQKLVDGFGPELIGGPVEEFQLAQMDIVTLDNGLPAYRYEILPAFNGDPHCFVTITATRNRVYILNVKTPEPLLQFREPMLRKMAESFSPVIAPEVEAALKAGTELPAANVEEA